MRAWKDSPGKARSVGMTPIFLLAEPDWNPQQTTNLFICIIFPKRNNSPKETMANHKSSVKRIRQTAARRLHNRYYAKTMRNAVRKLRATTDKAEAVALLPKVQKMLDKLAKNNTIHKNKASNIKSSLMLHVNSLA